MIECVTAGLKFLGLGLLISIGVELIASLILSFFVVGFVECLIR